MSKSTEALNPEILNLFNATRNLVQKALKEKRELPEDILATSFMPNDTDRFYANSNEDILSESLEWVRLIEFQNSGSSKQESSSQQLANQSLVNGYGKNQMTVFGIFLMLIAAISSGLVKNESPEINDIVKGLQQLNEAQQNMGNLALSTMARGATLYLSAKNKNLILLPTAFFELSPEFVDARTAKTKSSSGIEGIMEELAIDGKVVIMGVDLEKKKTVQKELKTVDSYKYDGGIYIQKKEFQKAINVYEEAIEKGHKDIVIYANLGYLYTQNNQLQKAIEVLNIAIKNGYANHNIYMNLAKAYLLDGNLYSGLDAIQNALEAKPNDEESASLKQIERDVTERLKTSRIKLQFLYKANRYEEAHKLLQEAHDLFSTHQLEISKEEYEAAILILQGKYNSSDPSPIVPFELAVMYQEVGQFEKAVEFYEEALNKETKPVAKAEIRKNIRNLSYKQAKFCIGAEKYDEAKEHLAKLKKYDEFASSEKEIGEITNLLKDIHLNAGEQMLRAGDEQKALEHFEELQNLDLNPEAKKYLGQTYFILGKKALETEDNQRALNFMLEAKKLDPNLMINPELAKGHYAVAMTLKDNDPQEAITHLEEALDLDSKNQEAKLELANLHFMMGKKNLEAEKYQVAQKHLQKASQLNPDLEVEKPLKHSRLMFQMEKLKKALETKDEQKAVDYLAELIESENVATHFDGQSSKCSEDLEHSKHNSEQREEVSRESNSIWKELLLIGIVIVVAAKMLKDRKKLEGLDSKNQELQEMIEKLQSALLHRIIDGEGDNIELKGLREQLLAKEINLTESQDQLKKSCLEKIEALSQNEANQEKVEQLQTFISEFFLLLEGEKLDTPNPELIWQESADAYLAGFNKASEEVKSSINNWTRFIGYQGHELTPEVMNLLIKIPFNDMIELLEIHDDKDRKNIIKNYFDNPEQQGKIEKAFDDVVYFIKAADQSNTDRRQEIMI